MIVGVLQKGFKDQSLQLTELQHLPQEEGEEVSINNGGKRTGEGEKGRLQREEVLKIEGGRRGSKY